MIHDMIWYDNIICSIWKKNKALVLTSIVLLHEFTLGLPIKHGRDIKAVVVIWNINETKIDYHFKRYNIYLHGLKN